MAELWHIEESRCVFGFDQSMEHPKDGLTAFGPVHLKTGKQPTDLRVGVVGTEAGIRHYRNWVASLQGPIMAEGNPDPNHSMYPGFEAAFRCRWDPEPVAARVVSAEEISTALRHADHYQAVYRAVTIFEQQIRDYLSEEEGVVDVWFVIIPEEVHELGRPKSKVAKAQRNNESERLTRGRAKLLAKEPSLFASENTAAEAHRYEADFRDQLKGRLLDKGAVVQVVRETTFDPNPSQLNQAPKPRKLQSPLEIAWNLSVSTFYKGGGQPWRLAGIRPGVCYVGMVYKMIDSGSACCGAQMFLDSGDGLVFRGTPGRWWNSEKREFHLDKKTARDLMSRAVEGYRARNKEWPREIFIHGKARFEGPEWEGFKAALPSETKLVGVRIRRASGYKLFRTDRHPVLRGTALPLSQYRGYLWTLGFIPRLQTYPGREVPNPLLVDICRGEADLRTVMKDVLALTKVNFNACLYGDGLPVTLRFADRVGQVLTAIPQDRDAPPLPFKHYI